MATEDVGALAPSSLSVDKRIILHLGRFDAFAEAWDVPAEVSQDGIGRTLGLLTNNVSRALSGLKNDGLIVEKLAHVKGAQRRKNAYFLSEAGRAQVDALTSAMGRAPIRYIDIDGERRNGTIGDVVKAFRSSGDADATVANVVEASRKMDVLDLRRMSQTGKGTAAGTLVRHVSKKMAIGSTPF